MTLSFAPLLPQSLIVALALAAALLAAAVLFARPRGAVLRLAALAALLLALVNPVVNFEDRAPVDSVVAILVDRSQSQSLADRTAQTDAALAGLEAQLARHPGFVTRIIDYRDDADADSPSTRLFEALASGIRDVPVSRLAGAILITDGQVHDIPASLKASGLSVPLHALITGEADERDRRIEIVSAPRFGIVGEPQEIVYRVTVDGADDAALARLPVTIRVNGEDRDVAAARPGSNATFTFEVPRGGDSIIEFILESSPDEITTVNNRAIARLEGIRENLRVLLVSGAPHAGERAWRNLLKSDAAVDLVHFTILRPPQKQDGTPITELSLIAFPTRELFIEKVDEFDLIIFDRYQNRGVLPVLYYDYIAQYVADGGALLVASGPELAGIETVADTPLAPALPARPTGAVTAEGFYPRLTEAGRRHPVTRALPGSRGETPDWGRWFRTIDVTNVSGDTVMQGAGDAPLLVLDRYGKGRVAMLLSDHGWLWARGFEGGGPHIALYRRIAHWLMQEPSLEEEALRAESRGRTLRIERQSMADSAAPVTVTMPSGASRQVPLEREADGLFTAEMRIDAFGLVEVRDGELTALAHLGAVDAPEFRAAVSTEELLQPLSRQSGGTVARVDDEAGNLPQILPIRTTGRDAGGRLVLRASSQTVLLGVRSVPLLAGFLGLALLLALLAGTWFRESR
ncbi:hypothetical protein [Pseudohoeflea coraliihabitans]|uniref:Glutamine amidotransferase domain-containing protein n=1 Tax=Pseudohoeflea coraliihabitans TaxID=2860393 RepID=A0ABS6WJK0_9HYPH|nr:hypothetical protein [Pseudohoeflea sp. DP4N28-3]MBW3096129.1 hypothetical protein [Pseudohoeflea sp. DP4N28-3]